jgi:hypothetical protein
MMYHYWKRGRIRPSVIYNMPNGEQVFIRAFFEQEIEDETDLFKRFNGKPTCPYIIEMLGMMRR